eukprot:TRINITY_DN29059_c0_g1_i4.p1 TRINITY_DN29059_c0_g1~~TRINITY_DN29059_c0_g1_i4.p1  ORF type:complete len:328 (+),score=73.26 TRINITY_DN29059_c0_g1_i4:147-986(+)
MLRSLVGSEMCIRDSALTTRTPNTHHWNLMIPLVVLTIVVLVVLNQEAVLAGVAWGQTMAKRFLQWSEGAAMQAGSVLVLGFSVPLGPGVIMFSYVVACIFMLPLFGIHSVSGYLYGTIPGALLVTISQTVGACCVFFISRFIAHNYLTRYLQRKWGRKYDAIDDAITQDSFKIVLMMRLSPVIPFGLTNYVAGCSKVPLGKFAAGTWLGLCPGTTFYVFMGSLVRMIEENTMSNEEKEAQAGWKFYIVGGGLATTAYLLYVASQKATKVLGDAGFRDD